MSRGVRDRDQAAERASTVTIRIARELVARMQKGSIPVGSIMPAETELADEFGVSRPSIREALSALQFAGYVEPRRGRGTLVLSAAPMPTAPTHVRAAASMTEVVELLEARITVEPEVLALAAAAPVPAALDEAECAVRGMAIVTGSEEISADTDHRLHSIIADVCPNAELRNYLKHLLARASGPHWRASQQKAWQPGADLPSLWAAHHAAIVTALEQGDVKGARVTSRAHLLSALDNAAQAPDMPPSLRRRLNATRALHTKTSD